MADHSSGYCEARNSERRSFARVSLGSLAAVAALALTPLLLPSAARADDGSAIFSSKCSACHTIGGGKKVGPDLKGVTKSEDPTWLKNWITQPSAVVKSGDAHAAALIKQFNGLQMPDLGLSSADVDSVIAYIGSQSGATSGGGAAQPAVALPAGDSATGREIFVGGVKLKNGGPPCMSCHSISGIGALGGGTLGPDLTSAYQKYGGDQGLASFLTGLPTPTMNAVWSKHPLTPQEIADVTAFIKEASVAQREPSALGQLALYGLLALVVLVLIIAFYWRKRLIAVRVPLVAQANQVFLHRKFARRS